MVRGARMVAARTSIGVARKGPARPFGTADRADRRRQDAGRLSADAGRAERCSAHLSVTSPLVGGAAARRGGGGGGGATSTWRCGLPPSPTPGSSPGQALPHKGGGS